MTTQKSTETPANTNVTAANDPLSCGWMKRPSLSSPSINANQRTSISAMIAYVSSLSGQSEFRLERTLSDRFHVANPMCLPANDFDEAIRYLADISDL